MLDARPNKHQKQRGRLPEAASRIAGRVAVNDPGGALREAALALGLSPEAVERAQADGTLELLALERLVAEDEPRSDLTEVAARTGVDAARILAFWRALGFPDPRPSERLFSGADVGMLAAVVHFIDAGAIEQALALQMARVIGSSLNRIATAEVDAIVSQNAAVPEDNWDCAKSPEQDTASELVTATCAVLRSAHVVPLMPRILETVWRRHLAGAARRRIVRASAEEGYNVCIGFVDLVGFTAQTRELPDQQLAEVVGRFETIAYDLVAAHGGRVVKMIGDEALFMSENVHSGAELALALAAAYRRDQQLSDVRVAIASGRVLERDGDVFGSVVNLASRIVHVAFPGSVVVSRDVHDALESDPHFVFRGLRQHYLKDIGLVPLWTLRSGEASSEERCSQRRGAEQPGSLLAPLGEQLKARFGNGEEASRRLRALESDAQSLVGAADPDTNRTLAEALHDARLRLEEVEAQAHQRIEEALLEAEKAARKAGEQARRKVALVMEATQRKADAAKAGLLRRAGIKTADGDFENE